MGGLCSKKQSGQDPNNTQKEITLNSHVMSPMISNANHSNANEYIKFQGLMNTILKENSAVTQSSETNSLIIAPAGDQLLGKCWVYKRGHLVRTWKKRFFVLDKSEIKYYRDSMKDPPFGKGFKGSVALLGAVCMIKESDNGEVVNIEIYGNHGEKDLFFYVENTIQNQMFLSMLQWAIRKLTITMLIRNLKSIKSSKSKKESSDRMQCIGWNEEQIRLFNESVTSLRQPQLCYLININNSGQFNVNIGVVKLWTIFGNQFLPTIHTEATQFGFSWDIIDSTQQIQRIDIDESTSRMFTFEDIADITYTNLDIESSTSIYKLIQQKHQSSQTLLQEKPWYVKQQFPLKMITIKSKFGYNIQFLLLTFEDYSLFFLSLQNILLYIQYRNKLFSSIELNPSGSSASPSSHKRNKQLEGFISVSSALKAIAD